MAIKPDTIKATNLKGGNIPLSNNELPSEFTAYGSVMIDLSKNGKSIDGGTSSEHSMEEVTINLKLETASLISLSMTVDDWGKVIVLNEKEEIVKEISMTSKDDKAGERGGHILWTKTDNIALLDGNYTIKVKQDNITYPDGYDPKYNNSVCNFVLEVEPLALKHVKVNLSRAEALKGKSKISGYVYRGTATVEFPHNLSRTFVVQSGGHMTAGSQWDSAKGEAAGFPQVFDELTGKHDASMFPDTCCPAVTKVNLGLVPSAKLKGYLIDTSDTLRTAILIHKKEREGSEGCVSSGDNWDTFVKEISIAKEKNAKVTCTVTYTAEKKPDEYRKPTKEN